MVEIAGKHALLELLRLNGVEVMFGNPGTTELALMDAFVVEDDPRYVLALHEGSAMGMAHGYSAATGKLSAVNLHAAPGLGNALGMLYNAKKAGAPILVTAGQHHTAILLAEPLLSDDLPVMARPYVKWAYHVASIQELPRAVHRACKVALTHPTGPVFLSIPDDVLTDVADLDLMGPTRVGGAVRADLESIARAAELIAQARAPMIFAGDAVAQTRAHAELAALAERIGAPVYCEAMADTAAFPAGHRLFAGLIARTGRAVQAATRDHDLVVSIGGDLFTMSLPSGAEAFAPGAKIVHLDLDPWELGKNFATQAALFGDPKATLPELLDAVEERMDEAAKAAAKARAGRIAAANAARRAEVIAKARGLYNASPIQPMALLHMIGEMAPPDVVVIEEILSSNAGLRDLILFNDPQSYFGLRGGGIGMALPQAIGAKLALPDRPVAALVGDGSALYNIQALWTAAHEKLAILFIVFNNRGYRILKQRAKAIGGHSARTGEFVGMDMVDPPIDYVSLAASFGIAGHACSDLAQARRLIAEGLASGAPMLIDVSIDAEL